MDLTGKVVWITGASSGVGLALAIVAVRAGAKVIISSSNSERLQQAAEKCCNAVATAATLEEVARRVVVLRLDVAEPQSIAAAMEFVRQQNLKIDILINNAGIGQCALIAATSEEVERRIFEINYWGAVRMTKAILPLMKNNGGGQIAVTSSVLGFFSIPARSSYAASKHAIQAYFSALSIECCRDGIAVTIAAPGRLATPFARASLLADGTTNSTLAQLVIDKGIDSERCAKIFWRAIVRRRAQVIIARGEFFPLWISKLFPNIYNRVFCWIMGKPKWAKKITY